MRSFLSDNWYYHVNKNWGAITDWLSEKWSEFKDWFGELWDSIVQTCEDAWSSTVDYFSGAWSDFLNMANEFFEPIGQFFAIYGLEFLIQHRKFGQVLLVIFQNHGLHSLN